MNLGACWSGLATDRAIAGEQQLWIALCSYRCAGRWSSPRCDRGAGGTLPAMPSSRRAGCGGFFGILVKASSALDDWRVPLTAQPGSGTLHDADCPGTIACHRVGVLIVRVCGGHRVRLAGGCVDDIDSCFGSFGALRVPADWALGRLGRGADDPGVSGVLSLDQPRSGPFSGGGCASPERRGSVGQISPRECGQTVEESSGMKGRFGSELHPRYTRAITGACSAKDRRVDVR